MQKETSEAKDEDEGVYDYCKAQKNNVREVGR